MEKYKLFLQDLVFLLKDELEKAHAELQLENLTNDRSFLMGRKFSLYESLDLIKSQANAFNISLDEIGLSDYILEKFI